MGSCGQATQTIRSHRSESPKLEDQPSSAGDVGRPDRGAGGSEKPGLHLELLQDMLPGHPLLLLHSDDCPLRSALCPLCWTQLCLSHLCSYLGLRTMPAKPQDQLCLLQESEPDHDGFLLCTLCGNMRSGFVEDPRAPT